MVILSLNGSQICSNLFTKFLFWNSNNISCNMTSSWWIKVVSATFSKRKDLSSKEKCFLSDFESSLHSWDNQILNFQIFKCHDIIKYLSMKHETHFTEKLGKQTQPGNEIWPVHVILQDNFFYHKIPWKMWPRN